MDGVHDPGGKECFGPVRWQADESGKPFHEDWKARAWGILLSSGGHPSWTLDWWRYVRERIEPSGYLTRNYFDQWIQSLAAALIDDAIANIDELVSGRARFEPRTEVRPGANPASAYARLADPKPYKADTEAGPAFAIGDEVRAKAIDHPHHTRLPAYARGRICTVEELQGGESSPMTVPGA